MRRRLSLLIGLVGAVVAAIGLLWVPLASSKTTGRPARSTSPARSTARAKRRGAKSSSSGTSVPVLIIPVPPPAGGAGTSVNDNGTPTGRNSQPAPPVTPTPVVPVTPAPVTPAPVTPVPPVQTTPAPAPVPSPAPIRIPQHHAHHVAKRTVRPRPRPGHIPAPRSLPAPAAAPTGSQSHPAAPQATPSLQSLPRYAPAAHEKAVLGITGAAVAALGALGAALGGGGAGRTLGAGGEGEDGGSDGGGEGKDHAGAGATLEDVELEREAMAKLGRGRGDRSRTWWWPFTRQVDQFSSRWPSRLARVSPVVGRVAVDADYLRAMLGSLWLLLYPLAIGLGLAAAASTSDAALPPTLGWFLGILALGIFDSMAGYLAGLAFAGAVVLSGAASDSDSVRELFGIVLVWFATPLAAGAVRPLRRNTRLKPASVWDRLADFVLGGLFGGWLAAKMTEALSPLSGHEIPLAGQKWTIALVVVGLVGIRIIVETIAAHHYPDRLKRVEHRGELESGKLQIALSLLIQIALFIFVARAFLSWSWPLFAGTVLFFTPLVAWLIVDRLPKSGLVSRWMPLGLAKWAFVIVSGVMLAWLLERVSSGSSNAEAWGFVLLPLPLLTCWCLELFAKEEEDEEEEQLMPEHQAESHGEHGTYHPDDKEGRFPMTWGLRLAGVPVLGMCVYLVLSPIVAAG